MLEAVVQGHTLQMWPQRGVYWPAQQVLLLADVHLGKADTLRHFGVGVPQSVQHEDLARLDQLLHQTQPQRCLILGDLVHGRILGADTLQRWQALMHAHAGVQFELIAGNHDRGLQAHVLQLHAIHQVLELAGVWLSHEPMAPAALKQPAALNMHGHVHAAVRLQGSQSKLPALIYQPPYLRMPAFSAFTAGVPPSGVHQAVWVFAPDGSEVLRLK